MPEYFIRNKESINAGSTLAQIYKLDIQLISNQIMGKSLLTKL